MRTVKHTMNEFGGDIPRSGEGLREALFSQLERLRDGEIDSNEARAFAGVSNAIVKTVEVQLKYEELLLKGDVSRTLSDQGVLSAPHEEKSIETGIGNGSSSEGRAKSAALGKPAASAKKTA